MELNTIPHKISHRKVKYPRIELRTGELHFVLPFGQKPDTIFEKHQEWITRKLDFIKESLKRSSHQNLAIRTESKLKTLVYSLAEKSAQALEVTLNSIIIRKMRSKWASLSRKRNLTVNALLKYLPQNLIDYIIFHELAHSFEKRHNTRFWEIVSRKFPNHQDLEKDLFTHWFLVSNKTL